MLGCSANRPWRYDYNSETQPINCRKCGPLVIERDTSPNAPYDLAFIEFTDRGNLFSRTRLESVYDLLERRLQDSSRCGGGLTAITYVHGWKHNARETDQDLVDFKRRLEEFSDVLRQRSEAQKTPPRCLLGIYVGWRGRSLNMMVARELTYWDRKSAAHQLGKGGLTEVLISLEQMIQRHNVSGSLADTGSKNRFLIIGHSFGATAVLSALNEIILERVLTAQTHPLYDGCVVTRKFGHGTVLLNPAIEANEILQLKEAFQRPNDGYCDNQQGLMHVISTRSDFANHKLFPLGQFIGTNLRWRQTKLARKARPRDAQITISEKQLDTTTIANYRPFLTGYMYKKCDQWSYLSYKNEDKPYLPGRSREPGRNESCEPLPGSKIGQHFYARGNEPVNFIYTDRNFMEGHIGVFNQRVVAYLAAIVQENVSHAYGQNADVPKSCISGVDRVDFEKCFNYHLSVLSKLEKSQSYLRRVFTLD